MGYLPCLCSSPLGCAGSSDTALLSPQQERQLTHRGKLTLKKKKTERKLGDVQSSLPAAGAGSAPSQPFPGCHWGGIGVGEPCRCPLPQQEPSPRQGLSPDLQEELPRGAQVCRAGR